MYSCRSRVMFTLCKSDSLFNVVCEGRMEVCHAYFNRLL